MKKTLLYSFLIITAIFLSFCSSTRRVTTSAEPAKLTFENQLTTVIQANCSPCHIPSKGGNKLAFDNYTNVKNNIDSMLRRIQLNPGDKGFMPFRKAKLSDSTIAVFKQWKDDGMLEK
jgi:hypothetical protein